MVSSIRKTKKTERVYTNVSPTEFQLIESTAKCVGLPMAELVRNAVLAYARDLSPIDDSASKSALERQVPSSFEDGLDMVKKLMKITPS